MRPPSDRRALRLAPLSPIHVGTGNDLDWMRALVTPKDRLLHRFDPRGLPLKPEQLRSFEALGQAALHDAVADPVGFIGRAQQQLKAVEREIRAGATSRSGVLCRLAERLESMTGTTRGAARAPRDVAQTLAVAEMVFDLRSGLPILPGSGLKGALRTAALAALETNGRTDQEGVAYEKSLGFPGFAEDPFSHVAVDDVRFGPTARSAVLVARNVKRRPRDDRPTSSLPVNVVALLPGGIPGALELRLVPRGGNTTGSQPVLDDLLDQCHRFHRDLWSAQKADLDRHASEWWMQAMNHLVNQAGPDERCALVRIGKFGTAESKTTSARAIRVRAPKSESHKLPEGTTFWLAGDHDDRRGIPFGWALLEWGDGKSLAAELAEKFQSEKPWADVTLPASFGTAVAATGSTLSIPLGHSGEEIARMEALLVQNKLSEDFLKSVIRRAGDFPDSADRVAIRDWIAPRLAQLVRQSFRRAPIEAALKKLG